jgi:ribosomal-protein-alanine N-acetyltransferase
MTIELRSWSETDAESLLRAATSEDLGSQFGPADLSTLAGCSAYIADVLAATAGAAQNFAISIDGRAVGNVGISSIELRHETGWAYYWLAANARGRGIAARALASAADWAFSERGLYRLELGHRVNNPASCRVAGRAGFVVEGVEREKLRYDNQRFDVETHARLRTDPAPSLELISTRSLPG